MRKLIAIATCEKFFDRAQAQRDTWVNLAMEHFDVLFFLGQHEGPRNRPLDYRERFLEVGDNYEALPAKVQAICCYALEHGYDYVFKADDDVFIVPDALLAAEVSPHDYIGNVRAGNGGYPAPYTSGFGYWLSVRGLECIANGGLTQDTMEDRWVGNTLAQAGIRPKSDKFNYRIIHPDGIGPRPGMPSGKYPFDPLWAPSTSRIGHAAVFGQLQAEEMHQMWASFVRLYPYYLRSTRRPKVKLEDVCEPSLL